MLPFILPNFFLQPLLTLLSLLLSSFFYSRLLSIFLAEYFSPKIYFSNVWYHNHCFGIYLKYSLNNVQIEVSFIEFIDFLVNNFKCSN